MPAEIDPETLELMREYFGKDPRLPESVVVEVESESLGDDECWSLADFRAILDHAENQIPEEFRATATINIRVYGDYASGNLEINFVRPETDDETQKRVGRGLDYARKRQERERATYEQLRQKYNPSDRAD